MVRKPVRPRAGFTLIELLVVIAIIAMLAGILFPVFARARAKGRQTTCLSNQKQIATAIIMYADDWEKYPDINWFGTVEGINGVTACPEQPDIKVGIAINGYLHGQRRDLMTNPSQIIACADATTTLTIETEFGRHGKNGAIVAHLDGSAVYAQSPEQAGRYACGKFPLQPIVVIDGKAMVEQPTGFTSFGASEENKFEYCIAGPYGSDGTSSKITLNTDFIGEGDLARKLGDASPRPGDSAPMGDKILDPDPIIDTPQEAGLPITLFKTWAKPTGKEGLWSVKQGAIVYNSWNCLFPGRSSYAAMYVYNDMEQMVTMSWKCDDTGKFWLNGETKRGVGGWFEDSNVDITGENTTFTFILPKGINYFLIKLTNNASVAPDPQPAGGMKVKVSFDVPLSITGALE